MTVLDEILARRGKTRAELPPMPKMPRRKTIEPSPDLDRILALPRRPAIDVAGLAADLTAALKTPHGQQHLWGPQALLLAEIVENATHGEPCGAIGRLKCGAGKTLVTALICTVLDVDPMHVVLMVPDSLRDRTKRDFATLAEHWRAQLPGHLLGYKELGRAVNEDALESIAPRVLVCDEAHKLRNLDAAVTIRVERWLDGDGQDCIFVPLSGTLTGSQLLAYQHIARWALRKRSPLPLQRDVALWWDAALENNVDVGERVGLGALRVFGTTPSQAAKGLNDHVRATVGFVATEHPECDASIEIRKWRPAMPTELGEVIREVELSNTHPITGELLTDAQECDLLCQLALGFCYYPDPLPPLDWIEAKREWSRFVRDMQALRERGMDTEAQIAAKFPERYEAWRIVEDTFTPNRKTRWLDESIMDAAVGWARRRGDPGIVWSDYQAVADALDARGLPHHGQNCLDKNGKHVEHATGPISASIGACGTGANLQHYRRSLMLTPPVDTEIWEQWICRLHRPGQEADEIEIDIISTIRYHKNVLGRARKEAARLTKQGDEQRLSLATWV